MTTDRATRMQTIRDAITTLTESPLYTYRVENGHHPVIGEGPLDARIMFVDEAPGREDIQTGRPLCGARGRVLDDLLAGVGINREAIYITPIVKDLPPKGRRPRQDEIALYAPFLDQQINIIQPDVIATLGLATTQFMFQRLGIQQQTKKFGLLQGNLISTQAPHGVVNILPLSDPAMLLYAPDQKAWLLQAFQPLKAFV